MIKVTVIETAKITSKGQVTVPNRIRKILHVSEGSSIAFAICKQGIILFPCKFTAESPYTPREWTKIEKLASVRGKRYKTIRGAKKHLASL